MSTDNSSLSTIILTRSREYTKVPPLRKDDNVIPSASDIPSLLSAFGNPRKRRISVGPQSEADAREFLASREQHRTNQEKASTKNDRLMATAATVPEEQTEFQERAPLPSTQDATAGAANVGARNASLLRPPAKVPELPREVDTGAEQADQEMFPTLLKPRTRYDVEVITKLVVYAGKYKPARIAPSRLTTYSRHCLACGTREPDVVRAFWPCVGV